MPENHTIHNPASKEERDAILDEFETDKQALGEGMLIRTLDIGKDERNAFYLPPHGDYCLQVGPEYEAQYTTYGNGTTQITIKKVSDA